jgi:peptidoglycan-associated lipoprotein
MQRQLFILLSGLILLLLSGCGAGNKLGAAKKAYEVGEYRRAATLYKSAYAAEKNKYKKGEISYYMGECYRRTNLASKATSAYSRAVRNGYTEGNAGLHLANSYLKTGKIADAKTAFENYTRAFPKDELGWVGLKSCELASAAEKPSRYKIEKAGELGSKYSDYSPVLTGNDNDIIYFSSMRTDKKQKKVNKITGQGTSHIYWSTIDSKGKWRSPEKVDEPVNSLFDEGALSITADGREMFITRCRFDNTKPVGAEIYSLKREGGRWSEPQKVAIGADSTAWDYAHPAISPDGSRLYFVSNMPDGIGGKDIWMIERKEGGEWGAPVNLGSEINTTADEMFPSVKADGVLYFSSEGRPGYGGLDIFKAVQLKNDKWEVTNIGRPLNSEADDFGITFKGTAEEGFLTSARGNLKGIDRLYRFILPVVEFRMDVEVADDKSREPIKNASVRLIGSDGTNLRLPVVDGVVTSRLSGNTDYVMLVSGPGFFNRKQNFTTVGLEESKTFSFNMALTTIERPIVLKNIMYDFGKWDLKPESLSELDNLYTILVDNPGIVIELGSHTDAVGNDTDNLILSQKRAQVVVDYLVAKGIGIERLVAKGYGENNPVVVDAEISRIYSFLKEGDTLTEAFINALRVRDREKANQINRRTEFRVIKK